MAQTHVFTSCGATGRVGPTLAQIRSAYSQSWASTYINQGAYQGYQDWTVPVSGEYVLDVRGAGGYQGTTGTGSAGRGARIRGSVQLTKGEIITIAVGQVGSQSSTTATGGSGGGTFVVRKSSGEPIIVAGGGSANYGNTSGRDGQLTINGGSSSGNGAGGVAGSGGSADGGRSAGGGGFNSRGGDSTVGERGGGSFQDGLLQVDNSPRTGGDGGFGGGGSTDIQNNGQSGGAGGYSGGAGGRIIASNVVGGGGGSFVSVAVTNLATSSGTYETLSTFNSQAITNLNSYNFGDGAVSVTLVQSFTTGNEVYPTPLDANNGTNKIAIESAGSSYHAFVPTNFDGDNNKVYSTVPILFNTGDAVTFNFVGAPPLGIQNGQTYYVQRNSAFEYQLSLNSSVSNVINLTQPSARALTGSSTISKVVVNTALNTLTINNHGFQVDQPLRYSSGGGTPISPLQNGATYYIAQVLDANTVTLKNSLTSPTIISFTSAGTGTNHSFLFLTVNAGEDTFYIPNHGLVSGQVVRYTKNAGENVVVPGLTDNTTYFVVKVDNSIIRLATNKTLTNTVNITDVEPWPATGTHSFLVLVLSYATDTFTIPNHGFIQGELVLYDSKGQTPINGLTSGTPYYVIFIDGDNIKLATTPENATAGTAVDITASPLGVGRHTLQSLVKTPDGIYKIVGVPSPNTFTVQARGNVPIISKIFNPRATVDLNLSSLFLPSHGFLTGTKVTYFAGQDGTNIPGIEDEGEYYVVSINQDYLRLALTLDDASAGITLPLTGYGTGVAHEFTSTQINGDLSGGGSVSVAAGSVLVNGAGTTFSKILKVGDRFRLYPPNTTLSLTFAPADVNVTTNRITKAHTFSAGDSVKFSANGGVAPSPLVEGYYYFVGVVSSTEITLHATREDAELDINAIDLSTQGTQGSGIGFTLIRTAPIPPIIRRITAVGSDTQITVDRPYASAYNGVSYSYPTFIYVRPEGYSLHRPFDGGVEMSAGAETSLAQIIRQTRKYFRYQSGKGLQTSCGINFKPSIDLESMVRFSEVTAECKTRRPHGLISGLFIRVAEAQDSFGNPSNTYNGDFQVTVVDLTTFRINIPGGIPEEKAYGFPQFFVREWTGGAVRTGMFDFQNGMFFEYDGEEIYCVRRSSTQQIAGTASALQGSEIVFGSGTNFAAQLDAGDYIVMRGQSYRVVEVQSDTRLAIRPEYKGSSGSEKEFNPVTAVGTETDLFTIIGHGFSHLLPVVYNSIDGQPVGGLVNGRTYYIDLESEGTDNNKFKLFASPDGGTNVNLSSVGTTTVHSFTPAKSGIIITKTVDTRVAQADWSIDPVDGNGPTGYNLDLSRIQMVYIDYSWYGAGKIRFGFKTTDGQVQYVHEFVHNNQLYESYFRSGNLPARYEVVTYDSPTYIPFLFHWGTSVMMDGRFDDDNAYLFTEGSQTLDVAGTTPKSFDSSGINLSTDLMTVQTHSFRTGDVVEFQSIAANGLPGTNTQHPATQIVGSNTFPNLTNNAKYKVFVNSPNLIHLTPLPATITFGATSVVRSGSTVTVVTATPHNLTTGMYVGVYGLTNANFVTTANGAFVVTVTNATTFTYTSAGTAQTTVAEAGAVIAEVLNFTTQGNTQYTYFLYPDGSLNNTSGPNYQPLISLRLSPSVSAGLTGKLGDRDVINRMQLRLQEIGVSTNQLIDVKLLLNPRLNNLNFVGVAAPSLTQVVTHTAADTVSGGVQVYNFRASAGADGSEQATTVSIGELFELSNSILGGDSIFPDGPDILTIAVSRLTGAQTLSSAKLSWSEAQA